MKIEIVKDINSVPTNHFVNKEIEHLIINGHVEEVDFAVFYGCKGLVDVFYDNHMFDGPGGFFLYLKYNKDTGIPMTMAQYLQHISNNISLEEYIDALSHCDITFKEKNKYIKKYIEQEEMQNRCMDAMQHYTK